MMNRHVFRTGWKKGTMLALTLTFGLAVAGCGTATPTKDGAPANGSAGQAEA
ncbi:ABC transporter substrate-binding protein, partial [Paenibacillus sp. EKM208P]